MKDSAFEKQLHSCIFAMDSRGALQLIGKAAGNDYSPAEILDGFLVSALKQLGTDWEKGRASLSQLYVAGQIGEAALETLAPRLSSRKNQSTKIVIGTLADSHGLGKKIVSTFLRSAGFSVIDLGIGVVPETFIDSAVNEGAQVIAISTLMLISAYRTQRVRELLASRKISHLKILVGGAPFNFNPHLWSDVGADAVATSAGDAITAVQNLFREAAM